jgi:type IV pilus biogenesis/stability protein PilW
MKKNTLKKICIVFPCIIIAFSLILGCGGKRINKKQLSQTHLDLGIANIQSRQYTTALRELMVAEKMNPKDAEIHYWMGITYYEKALKDKAIEEFKKALSLNPDYPEVHNYLGGIYLEMELYDKAIEEFSHALENVLYENPVNALKNIGFCYYKKGNNKRAIEYYTKALRIEPDTILAPIIHNDLGKAHLDEYNIDEALLHFKKAVEIAPSLVEPHYWLGICYMKKGLNRSASQAFKTVLRINPESRFGLLARERLNVISKEN